jgi:hypothetical protein
LRLLYQNGVKIARETLLEKMRKERYIACEYIIMEAAMRTLSLHIVLLAFVIAGCSSNVRFIKTNPGYVPSAKPDNAGIVFRHDKIKRPHSVVGVVVAELGKGARRPQLDALLIEKARDIGADGLMLVEYDVDRDVYLGHHHAVIGRGPYRRHVVATRPRVVTRKNATGIAVVFR